jgi:hypothetical protein
MVGVKLLLDENEHALRRKNNEKKKEDKAVLDRISFKKDFNRIDRIKKMFLFNFFDFLV